MVLNLGNWDINLSLERNRLRNSDLARNGNLALDGDTLGNGELSGDRDFTLDDFLLYVTHLRDVVNNLLCGKLSVDHVGLSVLLVGELTLANKLPANAKLLACKLLTANKATDLAKLRT